MTYNDLAELFKREGGDAQVCFKVISQNKILFGNNDTNKHIISFTNEEPITWVKEVQEEPVSEDLEEAALMHFKDVMEYEIKTGHKIAHMTSFKAGAKWQKKHLWKDAQGDDLPEIDREVIVLLKGGKVAFAHRPYKGKYLGKSLTTGNIETFENQTYGKGEWNIPDVKFWLNVELPKEIEL